MRIEAHVDVARPKVTRPPAAGCTADRLDAGRAYLVLHPLGLPRLHATCTQAVREGFTDGLRGSAGRPGADRLRSAFEAARGRLLRVADTLIEHELPDVAALGLLVDGDVLHVAAIGTCRAYLHRKRRTQRITSRDEAAVGILASGLVQSAVPLEAGDLLLAGTVSSFSAAAVKRVSEVLETAPDTSPAVLAQLLVEPAERSGIGAGVAVVRVP